MGNPVSYYNLHLTTHYFYCKIRFVFWKWWEKGNRVFALKGVCHVFLVQSCHPVLSSGRSVKYFLFEPKKAYRVSQKDAHFFWTTPVMIGMAKISTINIRYFINRSSFMGNPVPPCAPCFGKVRIYIYLLSPLPSYVFLSYKYYWRSWLICVQMYFRREITGID